MHLAASPSAGARAPRPAVEGLRVASMLGPGFVAAIAYIDPGNIATNLAAGATTGYLLVWVVVAASLVALLVQFQAAKLGVATGRSLPQLSRERFPRWVNVGLWVQAEVVVLATDLAEFVGAAVGLHLLFGVPVALSALVTGALAMGMLELRRRGRMRPFEVASGATLALVGVGLLYDLFAAGHQSTAAFVDGLVPRFDGTPSVVLALGIVGATVMPHAVYLHSGIAHAGGRSPEDVGRSPDGVRRALRLDCTLALGLATVVNVSMIALAAGLSMASGGAWSGDIATVPAELATHAGGAAALLFSVALLASGVSSSGVGTLAGEIVMAGFLARQIPPRLRRLLTMTPAVLALVLGLPLTELLVASQVVLSFGVPAALFLLVHFCRDRRVMGPLVNSPVTTAVAAAAGGVISLVALALPVLM